MTLSTTTVLPALNNKMVNFGLLTMMVRECMLTHSKSTLCVLHMLMHFSSGHVTATRGILTS